MNIICHESPLLDSVYRITSKQYLEGKPLSFIGAPSIYEHVILNNGCAAFRFEIGGRTFEHDGDMVCGKFMQVPRMKIRFLDKTKEITVIRLNPLALMRLTSVQPSDFVDRVRPFALEKLPPAMHSAEAFIAAVDEVSLLSDAGHATIEEIIDYIGTHFSELPRNSVRTLAERFGISESTLRRRFKRYTGVSLSDFLLTIKRRKMVQALFENNYDSLTVRENGYYDQSHFLNDFRRLYGIPLKHYKAQLQRLQKEDPELMRFLYRCNIS